MEWWDVILINVQENEQGRSREKITKGYLQNVAFYLDKQFKACKQFMYFCYSE